MKRVMLALGTVIYLLLLLLLFWFVTSTLSCLSNCTSFFIPGFL